MKKNVSKILFFIFIIFFLFIVGNLTSRLTIAPASVLYGFGMDIKRQISAFLFFNKLVEENDNLKRENARLLNVLVENKTLKTENKELKEALGYSDNAQNTVVLVKVSARMTKGGEDVLIINKGKDKGIDDGFLVTDRNGYLVGEILKSENNYAVVRLLNSPYFKISFKKPDTEKVLGILKGNASFSLESDMVSRDTQIAKEDIVLTTNINKSVENIIIGRVTYTEDDENLVFKKVFVRPLADLENIKFLFVVKPLNSI